jgi:hypothetical protein
MHDACGVIYTACGVIDTACIVPLKFTNNFEKKKTLGEISKTMANFFANLLKFRKNCITILVSFYNP